MTQKKGFVLLRDIIFMVIIFGGVMAVASIAVLDIADEYNNVNMTNEYTSDPTSSLGNQITGNVTNDLEEMKEATDPTSESGGGLLGSFATIASVISGAATILKIVFTTPVYVSNAMAIMLNTLGIPSSLTIILRNIAIFLIYGIIIFGIITALLRGGRV